MQRQGSQERVGLQIRCPHCYNPVDLLDGSSLTDIECPSCGSHFSLLNTQSTASYRPDGPKTIAQFELIERVGIGHFGSVWKARDTELDCTVALKIPRKDELDAGETEQFLREARAAGGGRTVREARRGIDHGGRHPQRIVDRFSLRIGPRPD